jgi:uncharacterized Zn finger protein
MSEADDFLALVALRSAEGDWAEAAVLWARVTAANPVNGDYWARLAEARFGNEEYEAAQQAYENFELPYSKVRANAADLFWQTSWPDDHRTWVAPDIYTPPTFEACRRNQDPAMGAILAIREHFPGAGQADGPPSG